MEYKKTRVAYYTRIQTMNAELSSCRTELETRDTRQTDYEHTTREVAREQQDTMELLRRNREEMNTRIEYYEGIKEKYVKLHVKHKKLQSTITITQEGGAGQGKSFATHTASHT